MSLHVMHPCKQQRPPRCCLIAAPAQHDPHCESMHPCKQQRPSRCSLHPATGPHGRTAQQKQVPGASLVGHYDGQAVRRGKFVHGSLHSALVPAAVGAHCGREQVVGYWIQSRRRSLMREVLAAAGVVYAKTGWLATTTSHGLGCPVPSASELPCAAAH